MRAFALALLVAAGPAFAQPDSNATGAEPEAAVRAVVARLFDGMRARDTAAVRATLHPDARFHDVGPSGETYRTEGGPASGFVAALGAATDVWDERVGEVEVRIDDGLATAWTPYRFYVGERFSHCGADAFTLVQDAAGWRILQLTFSRRTDCD